LAANPSASPLVLRGQPGYLRDLTVGPDSRWLVTAGQDETALLWDLQADDPTAHPVALRGHTGEIRVLAISPDGRWLATGGADATVRLWDLTAQDPSANSMVLSGHVSVIIALVFSPDSRRLFTASQDTTVRAWDLQTTGPASGSVLFSGHEESPDVRVDVSRDGRWLLVRGHGGADLRDLQKPANAEAVILGTANDPVNSGAFSPDSRWLAIGHWSGIAQLWDLQATDFQSRPIALSDKTAPIDALAFSPDSHWLAVDYGDGATRVWDLTARDPTAEPIVLHGHESPVYRLVFSPDGRRLAAGETCRYDEQHCTTAVYLWDVQGGADPVVLRGQAGSISALAFSADGRWLVAGGWNGSVRLWLLQTEDLTELACRVAGRNLTRAEWARYFPEEAYRATCPQWPLEQPPLRVRMP
jgi:WD40 repeat protein